MATIIGTRKMIVKVGGTDFTSEVSKCVISEGKTESDFTSFASALTGGARDYTLALTFRQNTASDSLWYYCWDNAGDEVAVEIWPNGGGTTEGASAPKFVGTVVITEPDGDLLGGEANPSNTAVNVVEVEWKFLAKPTLDITP